MAASLKDNESSVLLTPNLMCPNETAVVPVLPAVAHTLLLWMITIDAARLVDIVHGGTAATAIAIDLHDASIMMIELAIDPPLADLWRTTAILADVTTTPTVAIILPRQIPMRTADPLMNAAPETSLPGMDLIHAMDMRASMSAAGVTDQSTA